MRQRLYETLADAIKNNDLRYYKELLEESLNEVSLLYNENNQNIFHEIVLVRIPEKYLIQFVQATVDFVVGLSGEDVMRQMLCCQSNIGQHFTPLHQAIYRRKQVRSI